MQGIVILSALTTVVIPIVVAVVSFLDSLIYLVKIFLISY